MADLSDKISRFHDSREMWESVDHGTRMGIAVLEDLAGH
jgi:hypothetical protein